ncbi:MAG: hypothetical protein DRI22_00795 [Caldiserica bacterium]|nr:MAG: hypothetical protein DRI22_00795 [Caldisericota bacterium]
MKTFPSSPAVGVGVIVLNKDSVLIEKRGNDPGRGGWNLPGGTLKLGEKIFECAKREVFEEAGIEIEPIGIASVYELIEKESERVKFHYVIIDVVAEYLSGEIRVGSDALDLKWIKLEEVKDYPLPERVRDAIEKGRRIFKGGKQALNR